MTPELRFEAVSRILASIIIHRDPLLVVNNQRDLIATAVDIVLNMEAELYEQSLAD